MANNPYVNKVVYGNTTVMDISDSTAEAGDVRSGQTFYDRSGALTTGTAIGGIPEEELRDTVGWTGKNLIDAYSIPSNQIGLHHSATYTIASEQYDISIPSTYTTNSGIYLIGTYLQSLLTDYLGYAGKLSMKVKGSTTGKAQIGFNTSPKVDLTTDWQTVERDIADLSAIDTIVIYATDDTLTSGHIYVKDIMIRLASISDSTYEPYHETVDACKYNRSEANVLGAKNLIVYPYYHSSNSKWTVNDDGTLTLNGTLTANDTFTFVRRSTSHNVPKGRYIISKGYSTSDNLYCRIIVEAYNNDTLVKTLAISASIDEVAFDVDYDGYNYLHIYASAYTGTYNNLKIYPMLRLASDPDSTYVPYAMTNKELTDDAYLTSNTAVTTLADDDYFPFYDTSATAKRKTLWSNIKAKLKTYFDTLYLGTSALDDAIKMVSVDYTTSENFSPGQTDRYNISYSPPSGYNIGGVRWVTCSSYSSRWTAVVTQITTSNISVAVTLNYGSASTLTKVTVYLWFVRSDLL